MRSLKLNTNTESVLHAMLFSVFILIVHYTMGVACQSKRPSTCDLVGREREREKTAEFPWATSKYSNEPGHHIFIYLYIHIILLASYVCTIYYEYIRWRPNTYVRIVRPSTTSAIAIIQYYILCWTPSYSPVQKYKPRLAKTLMYWPYIAHHMTSHSLAPKKMDQNGPLLNYFFACTIFM